MRAPENEQEKAEVCTNEGYLNRKCEYEECCWVRVFLFRLRLISENACSYVNEEFTQLHYEYEAYNRQVGKESPSDRHQVKIWNLNRLMDLLDKSGLKE